MRGLQQAITTAHRIAREAGLNLSPSKINKVVRRAWHENPTITDGELAKCIAYADPTGEAAVRNVSRNRSTGSTKKVAVRGRHTDFALADFIDLVDGIVDCAQRRGDVSADGIAQVVAEAFNRDRRAEARSAPVLVTPGSAERIDLNRHEEEEI